MGCCGNKRASAAAQAHRQRKSRPQVARYSENPEIYFKYTGDTALRVRGMFTRRLYYFKHPGAILSVSGRDAPSMKAVPVLKHVRMG